MITASASLKHFETTCRVVPYGARNSGRPELEQKEASVRRLRQQHPRMILAIGRLVPYKGFASLLRALEGEAGRITGLVQRPGHVRAFAF